MGTPEDVTPLQGLYRQRGTHIPAVIRERDGALYVVVVDGELEIEAPIGTMFAVELLTRLITETIGQMK